MASLADSVATNPAHTVPTLPRASKLAIHFGADASRHVDAMLARQNPGNDPTSQRPLASGAIGCVGDVELAQQGSVLLFTGLPIRGPDLGEITDSDRAARLFPDFDGAFAGVHWDAERKRLTVATDCLGMQPLYMCHANGELTLVSSTVAARAEPDAAAWGAFISIGHPIGARSLLAGLERVPPASILTWDCARRRLQIRRYWQWPEASEAWREYDFLAALERDLRAGAALGDAGTVLLSGGFDSRLLLFLLRRARIPVDALIVAHPDEHGDADGRLAQAVARASGVRFRTAYPAADFFSSPAYLDYLRASDVGFPSLDLFIAKVAAQIDAPAVWDGLVPGFVFMPLHQPQGGFDAYRLREIRGRNSAAWRAAQKVFKPAVVEAMHAGFARDLDAEIARLPQDQHGLARFVIENRSRNRAAMNPLKVYAHRTRAFTPGLSKEFMTHAAMIPFEEKRDARLYRRLLARLDRRALSVPVLSGGTLLRGASASPAYCRERASAALRMQRARHPRLFPGAAPSRPARSALLHAGLLEPDPWLNPRLHEQLQNVTADNYAAWKLLFHWKAWLWLHQGHLERLLPDRGEDAP